MVQINLFTFQPFHSRRDLDTVLGLRFRYDARVVALIKEGLREAWGRCGCINAGGWLPEEKAWFVEWWAWPSVRRRLEAAGVKIVGKALVDFATQTKSQAEWQGLAFAFKEDNDFLRGLVHDLREESTAYARGVQDGASLAAAGYR